MERSDRRTHAWWRRIGSPARGFRIVRPDGATVRDRAAQERVRSLRIPPAWRDVRIAPSPRSNLQVLGWDAAGRKQYLYATSFRARRDRSKFERVADVGEYLPALRDATANDLASTGLTRPRVTAAALRLVQLLHLRVGSERGVARYHTYGVTTLRHRHVRVGPSGEVSLHFRGKHHIDHRRIIQDVALAAVLRELKALRGARLFRYFDEDGRLRALAPEDANAYVRAHTDGRFTTKDLRTWAGTLLAAQRLDEMGAADGERERKRRLAQAMRAVAETLGNTPRVARTSYVDPRVVRAYERGETLGMYRLSVQSFEPHLFDREELALMALLRAAPTPPTRAPLAPVTLLNPT